MAIPNEFSAATGIISADVNENFTYLEEKTGIDATHALQLPVFTSTERDALTPVAGMLILNTTSDKLNFYDGVGWVEVTST